MDGWIYTYAQLLAVHVPHTYGQTNTPADRLIPQRIICDSTVNPYHVYFLFQPQLLVHFLFQPQLLGNFLFQPQLLDNFLFQPQLLGHFLFQPQLLGHFLFHPLLLGHFLFQSQLLSHFLFQPQLLGHFLFHPLLLGHSLTPPLCSPHYMAASPEDNRHTQAGPQHTPPLLVVELPCCGPDGQEVLNALGMPSLHRMEEGCLSLPIWLKGHAPHPFNQQLAVLCVTVLRSKMEACKERQSKSRTAG